MNCHGSGLQLSEAAADFTPADERDVLDELAALTVDRGPWAAALALFVPEQRKP